MQQREKLTGPIAAVMIGLVTVMAVLFGWLSYLPVDARAQGGSSGILSCQSSKVYDASTNGSTVQVAAAIGRSTYICGYTIWGGGTATVKYVYGTGTTCGTGTTALTPAYSITAQTGVNDTSPHFKGLYAPVGNDVCITTSAGVAIQALLFYIQR